MKTSYGLKFTVLIAAVASLIVFSQASLFISLTAFSQPPETGLSRTAGSFDSDINPANGTVTNWGSTGSVAVDNQRRSVALDLGAPQTIRSVKLRDSDSITRATSASYTLWYSSNNTNYTQITGWTLGTNVVDGRMVHTLRGFNVTSRYIKINTAFTNTACDFVLSNLQQDLLASATVVGMLNSDTNPAGGSVVSWGGIGNAALDYQRVSVALDFGAPQQILSVKLRDTNSTSRITGADYTLWYSADNTTYTRINTWQFVSEVIGGRLIHTFMGFDVTARYLKINTGYGDTAYTFVLQGLQDNVWSFSNTVPDFGVTLHSDGDRLFPPDAMASEATNTIVSEVNSIADSGIKTLKMGLGTDVVFWNSTNGSPRNWRLNDPVWALSYANWTNYSDLYDRAITASNLFSTGCDPLRACGEAAKARGVHFFLSCRIADTHFTVAPATYPLTCKFYLEHEASANSNDWVAIKHSGSSPVPGYSGFDELLNFDKASVRSYRLSVICEALDRYKDIIDGFEIEFNRSVALFPLNQGASKTNLVTEFIQDVRDYMNALESSTNRHYYFGIRVPWDQALCLSQGLDVDKQIRDRRVDYIVPSQVMTVPHDMDIRFWIAAGKPNNPWDRGVAVYAGLPARKPSGWTFPQEYTVSNNYSSGVGADYPQVLGAARGFYAMGADGIELYNFAALAASAGGRATLGWLATNLARNAEVSALDRILAITPMNAKPYEGRLEQIKKLPVEFRTNGTVWVNSWDGTLAQQGTSYNASIFIAGRESRGAGEEWLLRLGIRNVTNQTLVPTNLNLLITLNGSEIWNGSVYQTPPANLIGLGVLASPAPTHYITIPIPDSFALKDAVFNSISIQQNSGESGFSLQEVQIGIFP